MHEDVEGPDHAGGAGAEVDDLIGQRISVLDDGFVQLVDVMGSDAAVVQAARVSYGAGTKTVREDRGLIRYLMRHRHTTPFEMAEIKLLVRVPMDTWRQWIRHRTASVNEYSTRYSIAIDAMQKTEPHQWRRQSEGNKQGSLGHVAGGVSEHFSERETSLHAMARDVYEERIEAGVAREQARKDLPLSTYTEAYWKIDLHNLLHFLELRMDAHAQYEIRQYASAIAHFFVRPLFPHVWEAFVDYRLQATSLSRMEKALVRHAIGRGFWSVEEVETWLRESGASKREVREFVKKMGLDDDQFDVIEEEADGR